jgi:hypothetical protein
MNPYQIQKISENQHQSCPCGAVAEHPYGLCRKCHAGMTWRRRDAGTARHASRRRRGSQARERGRILALATSMFRTSSKGGDL